MIIAQTDNKVFEELTIEYKNYISSCANKATGRYITEHDDEMSIALIAFTEAVEKYDKDKGPFLAFVNILIRNRIIDYLRKEYKESNVIPFSSLSKEDNDGDMAEFDIEDIKVADRDVKYEIEALSVELKKHEISFFELSKVSPKSQKTKKACFKVINYIKDNSFLVTELKNSGIMPIKSIVENIDIHRKVIERHRKYIIAAVIIVTGDYQSIAEYFEGIKEV